MAPGTVRLRLATVACLTRLLILLQLIVILGCSREAVLATAPAAGELRLWQDAAIFGAVRSALAGARSRIWVEMYEFDRPDLAADLESARARGAEVRLIVDPSVSVSVRTARRLAGLGLAVRYYPLDDRRHQIDHVKLLLTETEAVAGGMNWGRHSERNHDYALEIRPPPLLARLGAVFEQDWSLEKTARTNYYVYARRREESRNGKGERASGVDHCHRQAEDVGDARPAVHEIAEEHRLAAFGMAPDAAVAHVAEEGEQRLQLVGAAVDVADDVEWSVVCLAIVV